MKKNQTDSALILAGAVAKGAFEAGAIETIVQAEIPISRIVATSSGALNGFLLAHGLRKNRPKLASQIISEIWREQATWNQIFSISWKGLVTGQGLLNQNKLIRILNKAVHQLPLATEVHKNIEFKIVSTALNGVIGHIGSHSFNVLNK